MNQTENTNKFKTRLGMGLAYAGGSPIFLIISGYLVYFYTNVAGLNPGVVGTILLVSRIFDGFSDIIFGNVIDSTRTKMGVCRPWVFRMSILGMVGILSLFLVPHTGATVQYVYVFISYNFANTIVATLYQLAIIAFPSYLTRDTNERSIIYIWANTGQALTQVLISSMLFKAVTAFGGDQKAWIIVAFIISFIGMILTLISVALCKETVNPDEIAKDTGDEANVPFLKAFGACLKNKYWWMILLFVTFGTGVNVTTMTMTPYYSQYILGDTTLADILNSCFAFPMMIVIPFLALIVGKIGKRNVALIGAVLMTVGSAITIFVPSNVTVLCVAAVIKSAGLGCPSAVYAAMLADAVEYGQWKTGVRSQAVLVGAQSAGGKIGNGLMGAIISWGMAFAGFKGTEAVQTAGANSAIIKLYSIMPCVLAVLMIVILLKYDLDKRYPQIMKDLEERAKKNKGELA